MGWMDSVPLWDHHCHALLGQKYRADIDRLARCLTEAPADYSLEDIRHTVIYQEVLALVADRLGTSSQVDDVIQALELVDYPKYCKDLMGEASYQRLFIDTGYTPDGAWSLSEMEEVLGMPVSAIIRLETLAERYLRETDSFDEWMAEWTLALGRARIDGYIGAKSIVAYRSGLALAPVLEETARSHYLAMRARGETRLTDRDLLNYLLYTATPILMEQQLPLQFHTGYGDPDTDLLKGNPLLLRDYLETFTRLGHRVVLLHTYPYQREAGYLTSVYPGVYADVSLALPLAASGSSRILSELVELAPVSRVIFASDAHSRPESYYLGARFYKEGLEGFLDEAVRHHRVLPSVAESWAHRVGYGNASRLYGVS